MKWFAQAPSNIALIKYMGKLDEDNNIPINASLSYTLNDLWSSVELEYFRGHMDAWEPLDLPGAFTFTLDQKAQQRFLQHLNYVKRYFEFDGYFIVRSCNNFPMSSGLASSASSFAALTLCAVRAICELQERDEPSVEVISEISRHGSGSSCRSFYAPWALWRGTTVTTLDLPYKDLIHHVILMSHEAKKVASRDAHRLITTSPGFTDRKSRAEANLRALLTAFEQHEWTQAYEITWREFWDMHELFETAHPPFSYMTPETHKILNIIQKEWERRGDGPLVTMDAGPNIHLLYRSNQSEEALRFKYHYLLGNYDVL